jgi:hypothetical protein
MKVLTILVARPQFINAVTFNYAIEAPQRIDNIGDVFAKDLPLVQPLHQRIKSKF